MKVVDGASRKRFVLLSGLTGSKIIASVNSRSSHCRGCLQNDATAFESIFTVNNSDHSGESLWYLFVLGSRFKAR